MVFYNVYWKYRLKPIPYVNRFNTKKYDSY